MKKNIGIVIGLAGILVVIYTLLFTPNHSFNPVDSNSGLDASAALFFGGLVVFGAGVVIFASADDAKKQLK